jgi:aryl-alcohol dehydrogenase-like predicted oxidoreductase
MMAFASSALTGRASMSHLVGLDPRLRSRGAQRRPGAPSARLAAASAADTGSDYDADVQRALRLQSMAHEVGLQSVLELGLRFALTAPHLSTVLVGLSGIEHLEAAIGWSEHGSLPEDQFRLLRETAGAG